MQGDIRLKKLVYLLLPFVLISSFLKMWTLTGRERFAIIQAHWVIPNAPVAVLVGLLRRLPVVISLHGSDVYMAERSRAVGWVARWSFRHAAAVTASSQDLLERAQRLGATKDPARAVVIPYGADPQQFAAPTSPREELRRELGWKSDEFILLCVGRLVYKKGFEYALRALPLVLQEYPQARLVIAGQGDLERELKELARHLGVEERVTLVGAVPHSLIPSYLAACDLFLLPSVVDKRGNVDGLPNTLLEAMAAARPIVASRVAGVPLAIEDNQNGLLVSPGNPADLANAIVQLADDPDRREKLGRAARQRIIHELNWVSIAERYQEVLRSARQPIEEKITNPEAGLGRKLG